MSDDYFCCAITPDGVCGADAMHTIKHSDELEYYLCSYHGNKLFKGSELHVHSPSQPAQDERAGHTKAPRRRRP